MSWQWVGVVVVWVLAVVGAVLVGLFSPGGAAGFTWLAIVLAASCLAAFGIQLGIQRKEGFVTRVMASVTGSVVVLALASVVVVVVG